MDIRCTNCGALLAKDFHGEYIEIKCRKCKMTNIADRNHIYLTTNRSVAYSSYERE